MSNLMKTYVLSFCNIYSFICDSRLILKVSRLFPRRYRLSKTKNVFLVVIFFTAVLQFFIFSDLNYYNRRTTPTPPIAVLHKPAIDKFQTNRTIKTLNVSSPLKIPSETEFRMNWVKNKLEKIAKYSERWEINKLLNSVGFLIEPNTKVHAFYYASYKNPEKDGEWNLWNQEYASSQNGEDFKVYPRGTHAPPVDIGSNYYPLLGCYSSKDSKIVNAHLKQMQDAGIGVVVVSWHPDESANLEKNALDVLFETAKDYHIKIAIHIETYKGRNPKSLFRHISLLSSRYSSHPAFYKLPKDEKYLPVYYVYESYLTPAAEWRELLSPDGRYSVRGTAHDGLFIGLLLDRHHSYEIERSHFDGFYTYFSSNGFSYGSTWKNWKMLGKFAKKHKLLFFPSVSPGFIDTNVKPWDSASTRHRSHGQYYQVGWRTAIAAEAFGISISSFNKWQDGSQIEPAQPKATYLDYQPEGPFFYLNLTRYWVKKFSLQTSNYNNVI